ncbi:DUF6602 domain-containing protein [Aliarcobacter butzleri]|uniref:DUF6602 domain-containing protein n=1 Tax=Aliarcobacter butzleri TaxID=28197 RepID=UPI00126A1CD8|nr:DUF6602 domain-containing protein [Aliarcobacter butzleri]
MSKFYKQRSKNVNDAIKQRIIGAVKNFEGKYTESQVFKHSLSKGEYREQPIQEFFRELLPNKFAVLSGEIIDYKGNVSPQSDLIIYRNIDGIPVFKTEPTILLAESVMSIIEVKSKINLDEYEDCLKKAEKLYKLKPFGKSIQQYERGRNPTNKEVRIFISVFAYSSDSKMSMKDEYARFIKRAEELSINPCVIDRIYILNKGIINPTENKYSNETDDNRAFFYFYSNLLQFLMRESKRRDEVPYLNYFGRMTDGWEQFE